MITRYKPLIIFIVASLLSGCDENEIINLPEQKQEVKLNAGVSAVTKAPVNNTFSTDFPIGIYAKSGAWQAGSSANWINNAQATVSGSAGHAVTFNSGSYFYPSNGDTLSFYAFAPYAAESIAAGSNTSPLVTHTITGQEDIMWASATGQKVGSDPVSHPTLSFAHKLTQLQFTFKADLTYILSNKVISLKVKSQPTSVVMNVETGVCTFGGSADMQALSAANQTAGIPITLAGTDALSPVMTRPQSGSTAYFLDVVVKPLLGNNVTYSNIPINVNANAGNAHMIVLTFKLIPILPTATVTNWVISTGGSGTAV